MTALDLLQRNLLIAGQRYELAVESADYLDLHADYRAEFIEEFCDQFIEMDQRSAEEGRLLYNTPDYMQGD